MKPLVLTLAVALATLPVLPLAMAQDISNGADNVYKSDRVTVEKVVFTDELGMKVVGNLFTPKALDRSKATPAIVVGHPTGATKEQSANVYATKLAEQGFVTLDFDLSFWGESEGQPRNAVAPEIYVDHFSAAEPEESRIVPNAGHVDLYDRTGLIPFAKLTDFFRGDLS